MPRKRTPERDEERDEQRLMSATSRASDFWIESQARIFEHLDELARRWLDRRREALDATRQSFEEMRDSGDIGEVMRIQQTWLIGSMHRFAADLGELSAAALALARATASQIGRTTETTASDLEQTGQEMMSAAGSKPRTRAAGS